MAEENDIIDELIASQKTSEEPTHHNQQIEVNNAIFLSIVICGLLAHISIIYIIAKCKRAQSRTNIIIMNWIIFETISHNVTYPILHYYRVHEYSFVLQSMLHVVLLMSLLSCILCLNILLTDCLMTSNKTSFKEFMERFFGILLACFAFMLFWKLWTPLNIYMELILAIGIFLGAFVLVSRTIWKQCYRIVKWQQLNPNAELRLHVVMLFIIGKLLQIGFAIASVVYRSTVFKSLANCWGLSGFYIFGLLIVKDINFKISLCEVLGLNIKHPNDVATMISEEESNENCIETCIEA